MRESCKILAEVHAKLGEMIEPGISTWDIDAMGEKLIRSYGCVPNFLNYNGYRHLFVFLSMMRWSMEFLPKKEF